MYVPLDLDEPPKLPAGAGETVRRKAKREWKIQRERARRLGRQRVNEIVTKWQGTFSGKSSNGKYWKVGRIKRDVDWESKLGPVRKLCDHAVSQRPKGGESYASIGDLFD